LNFASSYMEIGGMMLLLGVASALYPPAAIPMLTALFERRHWGKVIGVHETAAGFSILTIPLITAYLLGVIQWRFIFLIIAAAVIVVSIIFLLCTESIKAERRGNVPLGNILRRSEFHALLLLWVSCGMLSIGIYNMIPLFLVNERGLPLEHANQLFSLSRIGGFAGQLVIGFLLDRYGVRTILFLLTVGGGLATIGLALVDLPSILPALLLLQGTFPVAFFPVGIVAIAKITEPDERGIFTGIIMGLGGMMTIGVTPFALGGIADIWSFQVGFILLVLLTLIISPLAFRIRKI